MLLCFYPLRCLKGVVWKAWHVCYNDVMLANQFKEKLVSVVREREFLLPEANVQVLAVTTVTTITISVITTFTSFTTFAGNK